MHRPKRLDGSYALQIPGPGVAAGGLEGQFLKKNSDADYDTVWVRVGFINLTGIPSDNNALAEALNNKAAIGHTHDDRYYKEDEIDAMLEALEIGLPSVADQRLLGNISGAVAAPTALTPAQVRALLAVYTAAEVDTLLAAKQPLNSILTALASLSLSRGDILYRDASGLTRLGAGLAGQVLQTNGAGADPAWVTVSGSGSPGGTFEAAPTKPLVAGYTLENPGTASMADGNFGIVLTMPSSTVNVRFIRYTAGLPGSTWTAIMRGSALTPYSTANIHHNCIIMRNTANGRLIAMGLSGANLHISRWASYTSFASSILNIATYASQHMGWKKVVLNGTTLEFYTSSNGRDWGLMATETLANYIGAVDQIGFGSINGAASSVTNADIFESFTVT